MHYLSYLLLILFASAPFLANAELMQQENIRYWQLFDSNSSASLEDIVGTPNNTWTPLPNGYTKLNALEEDYWKASDGATMWVKIELPRIVDSDRIWIELAPNVGLDGELAIYENGLWTWKHAAGRHASDNASFPATFLTFVIEKPREHRLAFLKIKSSQVLNFSINIRDHDSQLSLLASRNLVYGLCFGLMILAFVYNMVIGISAGERVYTYYASYVLCMSLYMIAMTGYNRLAFPDWGGEGSFTNLTACLLAFSATVFVRELLETKTTIPKLDILLRLLLAATFSTIFLLGFMSDQLAYICVETIGLVIPIIILVCAIGALKRHPPMAKLFLLAWTTHLITGTLWVWMWLGYTPPSLDTLNIFIAGSVTEQLLLAILLGYKYANLKQENRKLARDDENYLGESTQDQLTGVFSRQTLYTQIEHTIKTSENDLVWIDIDIDNFQKFNEAHGLHAGDLLLSEFGQLLQTKVRRDNLAAKLIDKENSFAYRRGLAGRVGGGKFTILLSNCSLPQARLYVERLMRDFEAIKIKSSDGKWLNSSISVGVVHILPNEDFNSAWKRASKKLLLAKSKGSAQLSFS